MRWLLSILDFSLLILNCSSYGRPPVGIAFYDVDRLYDTVPALFYDDSDYTPEGRLRWTAARYERKIRNTAAVIDSMALPIVALWGVENEQVVRDLAATCRGDYSYLHRTLNSLDGMDFALLYYGDLFYPVYDESGRGYLYVEGELGRDTVGLVLCSDPRTARWLIGDLREEREYDYTTGTVSGTLKKYMAAVMDEKWKDKLLKWGSTAMTYDACENMQYQFRTAAKGKRTD